MFTKKKTTDNPGLETAITKALNELNHHSADSPEFARIVAQLEKLYTFTSEPKKTSISRDQLLSVAGSLGGILMIILFERNNVLTSKALSFVKNLK